MEHSLVQVADFMENIESVEPTPAKPEPKKKDKKAKSASLLAAARLMEPTGPMTPRIVATLMPTAAATRRRHDHAKLKKT